MENKTWLFNKPPVQPTNEYIELFGEELLETIEGKLRELMERSDVLKKNKEFNLGLISQYVKEHTSDETREWFLAYWANVVYMENDYINNWMKYWIKLYERIKKKPLHFTLHKEGEITNEMVAKAKEKPIQELFNGDLRELGDKLVGICPFHGENTPSFTIFTNDNHFYCFGCNTWGDPIDFQMKIKKISMPEAVRELQT